MRTNTPSGAAAALILTAWASLGLWPHLLQAQVLHVDGAPAMAEPLARGATAVARDWRDDPAAAAAGRRQCPGRHGPLTPGRADHDRHAVLAQRKAPSAACVAARIEPRQRRAERQARPGSIGDLIEAGSP